MSLDNLDLMFSFRNTIRNSLKLLLRTVSLELTSAHTRYCTVALITDS